MRIIVVSHERSGTHFLINTIAINAGYPTDPINIQAESPKHNLETFLKKNPQDTKIFKSHHQSYYFNGCDLSDCKILVIYRDVRDVIASMFRYYNAIKDQCYPKPKSFKELAFELDPGQYPGAKNYWKVQAKDYVTRWMTHVDSWLLDQNHCRVFYHQLYDQFESETRRILEFLGLNHPENLKRPTKTHTNINFYKGGNGNWRELADNQTGQKVISEISPWHRELLVE